MLLLSDGELHYTWHSSHDDEECWEKRVSENESVCEACLWTPWVHLGDLQARSQVQLVFVDSAEFRRAAEKHGTILHLFAKYAAGFVRAIIRQPPQSISDLLSINTMHIPEAVSLMS